MRYIESKHRRHPKHGFSLFFLIYIHFSSTDRSGFWGPWTNAETTFSNEYYRLLLEERWSPKLSHNGKPWTGPDQYEDSTGQLMMLPTDIMLVAEPEFKKWVEVYAKDEVCCDSVFEQLLVRFGLVLCSIYPFR